MHKKNWKVCTLAIGLALAGAAQASPAEDAKTVGALDVKFQAATKANDAVTIGKILHDDYVLARGDGVTYRKSDLVDIAKKEGVTYEMQDEEAGSQTVRVYGDTAVVTAKLLLKGVMHKDAIKAGTPKEETPFDKKVWFSDVYVRTPSGWLYVFGQSSLPLPNPAP